MPEKRTDETQTAFAIRLIREEERERCAQIAVALGRVFKQMAMGNKIADQIRNGQSEE